MQQAVKIKIDAEGNGEAKLTIPKAWETMHMGLDEQPSYFYFKIGDYEFPKSYSIENTLDTVGEVIKELSNRI